MQGVCPNDASVGGDEAKQLDELVERFAHRVQFFARRVAARFGLDPQWHDDLVSSGYWGLLKALRNRRADAHEHELSAYVSKRVEGAVIDEARRVLTRVSSRADFDPDELDSGALSKGSHLDWEPSGAPLDPEDQADQLGRWRSIELSVGHLGRSHRDLLWAYAEGSSLSEIARRDGLSASRLQNQMSRITRQIRARSPELRRLLRHEI
jgi:RNA polymerase sigma factor (sigma-70 family)